MSDDKQPDSHDPERRSQFFQSPKREAERRAALDAQREADRLAAKAESDRLLAEAAREAAGLPAPPPLPPTWCSNCELQVQPEGKGKCPRCGRILPGSFVGRRHINIARRDQLHAENLAEYQPGTLALRRACQLLADVMERLERVKHGNPDHPRLVQMWTQLTETLESSRPSNVMTDLERLSPDELVAEAERVLEGVRSLRDAARQPMNRGPEPLNNAAPSRPTGEPHV